MLSERLEIGTYSFFERPLKEARKALKRRYHNQTHELSADNKLVRVLD